MSLFYSLSQHGPFRALPRSDHELLVAVFKSRTFSAGTTIISTDASPGTLFVLLEGRVIVSLYSSDGKEVIYRDIEPGGVFGELSAIDGLPRSAQVRARTNVRVGTIAPSEFRALIGQSSAIRDAILCHLTEQIRSMTDRIFELRTTLVRERLIRELIRRARLQEDDNDTVALLHSPTDAEFAAQIGTHREAVTRIIGELRSAGYIEKVGRRITIRSLDGLHSLLRADLS
ncbi:MAG: Crp/Fnr family transcriptional regulator [Pseudomonadota bacterium]